MPEQPAGADIDARNVSPVVRGGQARNPAPPLSFRFAGA
jgi:hypothetical protein